MHVSVHMMSHLQDTMSDEEGVIEERVNLASKPKTTSEVWRN